MIPVDFLVIEERLKEELLNLARLREALESRRLLQDSRRRRLKLQNEWTARAVGSILHDFYSAIEKSFRIIARDLDGTLPRSSEWHNELLNQMAIPIPGIRPAIISPKLRDSLRDLLGFHHVFRNVYGFNLDPEKLDLILGKLPVIHEEYEQSIITFLKAMHAIMEKLSEPNITEEGPPPEQ